MRRGVNRVILIGNCGQDPETKHTAGGAAVTNLSVATSETWKDKQTGQPQERTEWHRVVFFNRLAEIAGEYLRKGAKVYIEGSLRTRKWQDQGGQDRYSTEIVASEMQMIDARAGGQASPQQNQNPPQPQGGYQSPPTQQPPPQQGVTPESQPPPQARPVSQQAPPPQAGDMDDLDGIPF